jgi:hypothetical protein
MGTKGVANSSPFGADIWVIIITINGPHPDILSGD